MNTNLQIVLARAESLETIPSMTDPLGKYWIQPNRRDITVDDTHAMMSREVFNELHTYSATNPTGVYVGKMWKRHDGAFDYEYLSKGGKPVWKLCWYGNCDKPDYCSVNHRVILLSNGELPND